MKTEEFSVSAIVPVYNERELLEPSMAQIASFLDAHFADYEILIVESGSTDGTDQICDRLAGTSPMIRVLHQGRRAGFGSAVRLGYECASKDLIWLIVVDLPFPLETILRALPLFSQYDCVFSYRSSDDRDVVKRLRSIVYNLLAKRILGLHVKHVNSAFRVFKRDLIQNLPLHADDWTLDAEVLFEITRRGVPYTEIPVGLIERSRGRTSILFGDPLMMLRGLFRIRAGRKSRVEDES